MTPSDRKIMLKIWDQWRARILQYALASGRPFEVDWLPPFRPFNESPEIMETRRFAFETTFGCLSNWEVWYVTCEGELVEYGV